MLEAANAAVPRITPAEVREMMDKGDTLIVDVRDAPELEQSGKVGQGHSMYRAACWSSAPIQTPLITTRISAGTRV
jgi:hypothetical protein